MMSIRRLICGIFALTVLTKLSNSELQFDLQKELKPLEHCRKVVHLHSNDENHEINMAIHDTLTSRVPVSITTKNATAAEAQKNWDAHGRCLLHLLFTTEDSMSFLAHATFILWDFAIFPDVEYNFVVTTCHSCSLSPNIWFDEEVAGLNVQEVGRGEISRPFLVIVELTRKRELEFIHNLWLYCENEIWCVHTLNLTQAQIPSIRASKIQHWLSWSFEKQQGSDYKQWDVMIDHFNFHELTETAINMTQNLQLRPLFYLQFQDSNLFLLRLALEITRHLNASAIPMDVRFMFDNPTTGIYYGQSEHVERAAYTFAVVENSLYLNFMYCENGTLSDDARISLLLEPLDKRTWSCLAFAAICIAIISKRICGYGQLFTIFRSILQPDFEGAVTRLMCVLMIWTSLCGILACFYACEVQSILVVPMKKETIENFQQLAHSGYRLLSPWNLTAPVGDGWTQNWFDLETGYEMIKSHGQDFWPKLFGLEKRALLNYNDQIQIDASFINSLQPDEKCYYGSKPIIGWYNFWFIAPPNGYYLEGVFHKLHSAGITKWYYDNFQTSDLNSRAKIVTAAIYKELVLKTGINLKAEPEDDGLARLEDMKMVLVLFGLGVAVSFVSFVLQVAWYYLSELVIFVSNTFDLKAAFDKFVSTLSSFTR